MSTEEDLEVRVHKLEIEVTLLKTLQPVLLLPAKLQQTASKLMVNGRMTAEMASKETRRARAIESSYLNELVTLGVANKERVGRTVWFSPKKVTAE